MHDPTKTTTGLLFCMDFLAANLDWLAGSLAPLADAGTYVLFDLPGQCELFTQHPALRRVVDALTTGKGWGDGGGEGGGTGAAAAGAPAPPAVWRLAAVHLLDAVLCTDPAKYLAGCLDALGSMLHLELPHINVLAKVDRLRVYGRLAFDLAFYARPADPARLAAAITTGRGGTAAAGPGASRGSAWGARHARLTQALTECVDGYALLRFHPLAVEDEATVGRLAAAVDAAAGWVPHPGAGLPGTHRDGALPPGVGDGDEDTFLEEVAAKYGLEAASDGDGEVVVGDDDDW
jgi:hypothetical protein